MRDPGLWTITVRLSDLGESHALEIMKAVQLVVESLDHQPISELKLNATKKRFRNSAITRWFSTPDELAGRIAWYTNFERDLNVINRIFDSVESVTASNVVEFARQYLKETRRNTVILRGRTQ